MADSLQHRTMRDVWRILVTGYLPKVYETQMTLISPLGQADQALTGEIRTDAVWEVVLKTQQQILTSEVVLRRTLARADHPALKRDQGLKSLAASQPDSE